jgi:hypothetical protein
VLVCLFLNLNDYRLSTLISHFPLFQNAAEVVADQVVMLARNAALSQDGSSVGPRGMGRGFALRTGPLLRPLSSSSTPPQSSPASSSSTSSVNSSNLGLLDSPLPFVQDLQSHHEGWPHPSPLVFPVPAFSSREGAMNRANAASSAAGAASAGGLLITAYDIEYQIQINTAFSA